MVDSASLLVVIYLLGRIGAPLAAEMNTKVGTFSLKDSCANAIAVIFNQHKYHVSIIAITERYDTLIGCNKIIFGCARTRISIHELISQLPILLLRL